MQYNAHVPYLPVYPNRKSLEDRGLSAADFHRHQQHLGRLLPSPSPFPPPYDQQKAMVVAQACFTHCCPLPAITHTSQRPIIPWYIQHHTPSLPASQHQHQYLRYRYKLHKDRFDTQGWSLFYLFCKQLQAPHDVNLINQSPLNFIDPNLSDLNFHPTHLKFPGADPHNSTTRVARHIRKVTE
ncbi:hypothetical protein RRG08_040191 [Elysia crispata]|uniref:Uncharacterized protein n=1 Tax=Elysia crispata TaxID=231223 RepID=A0AAE0XXA3_9GAST|nr:hypothetical protein RRG08_040191 [Elysia crispata]